MLARVFTVLSALFFVAAVGIAVLTQMGSTLAAGLRAIEPASLGWIQEHCSAWVLNWIAKPVLERPPWLVPVSLGVVFAGLAASFSQANASTSRRRRS